MVEDVRHWIEEWWIMGDDCLYFHEMDWNYSEDLTEYQSMVSVKKSNLMRFSMIDDVCPVLIDSENIPSYPEKSIVDRVLSAIDVHVHEI